MKFTHLHTHSHYSLLDGLAKIDDLVNRAKEFGMSALALTDHGNLYGAVEFYKKATKAGIKPILGVEAYLAPGDCREKTSGKNGTKYFHFILLAENTTGWKNLIKLVTTSHLEGYYYKPRVDKNLLRQHHEGLIALSGCLNGEIPQLLMQGNDAEAERIAQEYISIFGKDNFFLELQTHAHIPEVQQVREKLIAFSKKTDIPLVATQDIHYAKPEDSEFHDIFLAVQTGNKIEDSDRLTLKADDFSMRDSAYMIAQFKDVPEAAEATAKIAERCNVTLALNQTLLPHFTLPDDESSSDAYLRKLCTERLPHRYPDLSDPAYRDKVYRRLDYELDVIAKTGFADYFLIVQDFVNWAKNRSIVVGPGRGSAAGSLVSYVLNITDIDPLEYDLLFERFLNPERISMPDIDLDFTDVRRDEVLAYVRQKYGEDHVAQIITFGTMAARAAIRDVGRALGIAYGFCDQLAKLIPFGQNLGEALESVAELRELYDSNPDAKRIIDAAQHLEGVVRHASVHACGVVISKDPLTEYVPLQYAPQGDTIILTQFEMHSIEDLGLLKMDFLGLKNLTIIEETVRLIEEIKGEKIDISTIPLDDKATFKLLQEADTTGIFQLESSGMRRYLKELKPTEFEDIIAMVSLYRPGPMELIPSYINRKYGREEITYLHPDLEPILKNTYGIGIYQEQMMRIARDLAGFSLPEADTLRKAIGKKIKVLLDAQREKLLDGMKKNGIDDRTANAIWELFPPFARYGFNRSHGACYALIGYRTAYLKAHYPTEFMTSLLNADSGDVERIAFLISEANKNDLTILPPDINASFTRFVPEGTGIRFGLLAIKNVGGNIVEAIINERQRGGPFADCSDFLRRVMHKDLNKKSLESLIKVGAFDSLNVERGFLLFNMDHILSFLQSMRKSQGSSQDSLFGGGFEKPSFLNGAAQEVPPAPSQDKLLWEKELMGLYLSGHPLDAHRNKLAACMATPISEMLAKPRRQYGAVGRIGGIIVSLKRIVSKLGKPIVFAQLEDLSGTIEVVVFTETLEKNPTVWRENNVILMSGRMTWRNGDPKFVCQQAVDLLTYEPKQS